MASKWNADFLDLADAFLAAEVEFVIVGAFALAAHGLPRATGDIDFLVRPSTANAPRVIKALAAFGAPLSAAGVAVDDFTTPGAIYQIGIVPRRIDVITQISGVSFDEAAASRVVKDVDGRPLPFLGFAELLRNKRAAGRPKDLADADALERLQKQR